MLKSGAGFLPPTVGFYGGKGGLKQIVPSRIASLSLLGLCVLMWASARILIGLLLVVWVDGWMTVAGRIDGCTVWTEK